MDQYQLINMVVMSGALNGPPEQAAQIPMDPLAFLFVGILFFLVYWTVRWWMGRGE